MIESQQSSPGITDCTKPPQSTKQTTKFEEINDVEMGDLEMALEQKLVLPKHSPGKRSRENVGFHPAHCTLFQC